MRFLYALPFNKCDDAYMMSLSSIAVARLCLPLAPGPSVTQANKDAYDIIRSRKKAIIGETCLSEKAN